MARDDLDLVMDKHAVAPALVDYAEPWSAGRVLRILATNKAQTSTSYSLPQSSGLSWQKLCLLQQVTQHRRLACAICGLMAAALCYYGCFLALGLAIAALGPALLALAENTGSSVRSAPHGPDCG